MNLIKIFNRRRGNLQTGLRSKPEFIDFSDFDFDIIEKIQPYTMTSPERVKCLIDAIRHIHRYKIEGSIVECGVWKGGSTMAALYALKELGDQSRDIYLYDTFEGMSEPTEEDKDFNGSLAKTRMENADKLTSWSWCYSALEEVIHNIGLTGYPTEHITFVKGKVEETLLQVVPEKIALLRLDTDWYESTKAEMDFLYPRVVRGGVIIIDDYGHWQGARKAVDEYIAEKGLNVLLHRIDYTARIFTKP